MKIITWILLALIVLPCGLSYANDNESDISYYRHDHYEVAKKKNKFVLHSISQIKQIYLSERSTSESCFFIYEKCFAKVDEIKSKFKKNFKPGYKHATDYNSFFSDDKIHHLCFKEEIEQGDSIYYKYSKSYDDIIYMPPIVIPNYDFLSGYIVSFKHPEDIHVDFEFFFSRDTFLYNVKRPDKKTTFLIIDTLPFVEYIPLYPYSDFHASILTTFHKGDSTLNNTTIPEFMEWYANQIDLSPTISDTIAKDILDSISERSTDLEKLSYIQSYITNNVRFIGDSRLGHNFFPFPPESTLINQYGDCKDRSYLFCALARHFGIDLKMALAGVNHPRLFNGMHLFNFNHVFCAYENAEDIIYIDPTRKYCRVGDIPDTHRYGPAFILDTANPRFEIIKNAGAAPKIKIKIKGSIDSLQNCRAEFLLSGTHFRTAKRILEDFTKSKAEIALKEILSSRLKKIEFADFEVYNTNDTSLSLSAKADISHYFIQTTEKIYLPKIPFVLIDNDIIRRENDIYPIYLGEPNHIRLDMILTDLNRTSLTDSLNILKPELAEIESYFSYDNSGTLRLESEYKRIKMILKDDERDAYIDFCRQFLKLNNDMYIIEGD